MADMKPEELAEQCIREFADFRNQSALHAGGRQASLWNERGQTQRSVRAVRIDASAMECPLHRRRIRNEPSG